MKYFIKVILPPLFAFWAFALFIKYTPFFRHVDGWSTIGDDSVYGLIAYYKIFAPVQIVIAVLTQWLIAMPLWNKILAKPKAAIIIFAVMLLVCLLVAFGIAYIIWDPATTISHFKSIGLFMTGVQLFYWVLNFLLLFLLDWKAFRKPVPVAETEE